MYIDEKYSVSKALNGRNKKAMSTAVFLVMISLLAILPLPCSAHPPSNVSISYDGENQMLQVAVTHQVSTPASHYVYKIAVDKNGEDILEEVHKPANFFEIQLQLFP